MAEVVTIVDATVDAALVFLKEFMDTIGVTDTLSKVGTFARSLVEAIPLNDILLKSLSRRLAEVITIVQAVVKTASRMLDESVTIAATLSVRFIKLFTETITIIQTFLGLPAKMFIETITINEVFSKIATFARTSVLLAAMVLKPIATALHLRPKVSSEQTG